MEDSGVTAAPAYARQIEGGALGEEAFLQPVKFSNYKCSQVRSDGLGGASWH